MAAGDRIGLEAQLRGFAEDWIVHLQKEVRTLNAEQEIEHDYTRELRLSFLAGQQKGYHNMYLKIRESYRRTRGNRP